MRAVVDGAGTSRLDRLTIARKEGWKALVEAPPKVQPEQLSRSELAGLAPEAKAIRDRDLRFWHANLGPIKTPQLEELHHEMADIFESEDPKAGDLVKGAMAVEGFPGLGKTTAVLAFAKEMHRRTIAEEGTLTEEGHERWPVARVGLTGNTGMKDFNKALLDFYGHPGTNGTTSEMGKRALDCVLMCDTRLLIIDDLHFLQWRKTGGMEVSNHFKYIANEFPIVLLFIGVGLRARGLFSEGESEADTVIAQTGRRSTPLVLKPFTIADEAGRRAWRNMLLALEQRLVLVDKHPGMLADDLSDYLFARSTGHIGSLMTLINRGCQRALRTGLERLDADLLDKVKIDAAAEAGRAELELALQSGRLRSKPRQGRAIAVG
ncbi:hypothetical protein ABH920_002767 [Catenulispora sp. EB89]|uniref:AAA family ATPase n=1 Tax=Catenulispora sp. EB89 TaxID=3156257 RepID=UPI00351489EA